MKISTSWGSSKTSRKGRRTVLKTKIRWERLGLQNPDLTGPSLSIEDIRRQVTVMASRGLGPGTRSRSAAKIQPEQAGPDTPASPRKRRRGATE